MTNPSSDTRPAHVTLPLTTLLAAMEAVESFYEACVENQVVEVDRALLEAIVPILVEDIDGGCDHSVNICNCSQIATLAELKLALDGLRTCPACHGDGFLDDWSTCPICNGSGSVAR